MLRNTVAVTKLARQELPIKLLKRLLLKKVKTVAAEVLIAEYTVHST
jgi:hypothetical protein